MTFRRANDALRSLGWRDYLPDPPADSLVAEIIAKAEAHGLTLPSGRHPLDGRRPPPPKARIVTGGIVQPISHSTAGTIAELLAAADLMARGWQVFFPLVRSTGHDLIACRGAELVTVEVRSAIRNAAGAIVFNKKTTSKSDHHAYVVTGEIVTYRPELPL